MPRLEVVSLVTAADLEPEVLPVTSPDHAREVVRRQAETGRYTHMQVRQWYQRAGWPSDRFVLRHDLGWRRTGYGSAK